MGGETLEFLIKARDEATATLAKVRTELGQVADKANLTHRAMGALESAFKGVAMGVGFGAFLKIEELFGRLTEVIPYLIEQGVSYGETVNQLALQTGATAEKASTLLGVFQLLGVSTDNLGMRLTQFSKAIEGGKVNLAAYGIATKDANGHNLDSITVMENVRHALSGMEAGYAKAALSAELFGRGAAQFTEYLAQNDAQMALLIKTVQEFGLVIDEQGVMKAEGLGKTMNLVGAAVQGLANKLLNDVAPIVAGFVQSVATWIAQHASDIANFVATAINFVIGFVNALTGANIPMATFGSTLEALGQGQNALSGATDTATGAVNRQASAVKSLDAASQLNYTREMRRIDDLLRAQLSALDAKERAQSDLEAQARRTRDLASAEADLAKAQASGDPNAIASARQRVADAVQAQQDAEMKAQDDARRAQLEKVKAYIASIQQLESEEVNRKKLRAELGAKATALNSAIAAAKQRGDAQAVADYELELSAVKAAKVRAIEKDQNDARMASFTAAANKIAGVFNPTGVKTLTKAIDPGLKDAMKTAFQAGIEAANNLKDTLAAVLPIISGIAGAAKDAGSFMASIPTLNAGQKFGIGLIIAGFGAGTGNAAMVLAGLALAGVALSDSTKGSVRVPGADVYVPNRIANPMPSTNILHPGRAIGGPVSPYGTFLVGERGPELLTMGATAGHVTPNAGTGFHGTVNVFLDGKQLKGWISRVIFEEERAYAGPIRAGSHL